MNSLSPIVLHRFIAYLASSGASLLHQVSLMEPNTETVPVPPSNMARRSDATSPAGLLVINADDWGRNRETTDRVLECLARKTVSSVSAMVFMEDSERAAAVARERGVDVGLHLNFSTDFSASYCPPLLREHQQELARHLLRHRLAKAMFYPRLMHAFEYVVSAQMDEFSRLYGAPPDRLDGHHHMHLCANVVLGGLVPSGMIVRRNFSFQPGEKSWGNRLYRQSVDRMLARSHRVVDFFFSLAPLEPAERLQRIFSLSSQFVVEVETHPVNLDEYRFLAEGGIFRQFGDLSIAPRFGARA